MEFLFGLLVGLGIFLYGMHQLETAAKDLSGRRLKSWLLTSTNTPLASISSGIFLTALLQSSSLVGLIVLAFASAEVIPLINAIGVFLGANLGTTLTGWIVTVVGFKLDIAEFALPMIAVGGISQIIFGKPKKEHAIGALILGLGLLLFGLSLMKNSVGDLPETLSMNNFQGYRPIVYLLIGAGITAVIQSSSAMMMIALTSLHAGIIDLPSAAALVIGADLGTTSTIVLGSLAGNKIKRQLAFAHCFFNIIVNTLAFFLILPFLKELLAFIHLSDPLFGLVAFHSFFNLVGLLLFLPFIKPFSRWIESLFMGNPEHNDSLSKLPSSLPDIAIPIAIESIKQLWQESSQLNLSYFDIALQKPGDTSRKFKKNTDKKTISFSESYENIKNREGDILQFILKIQEQSLNERQAAAITHSIETIRAIVYGSKTLKDIYHNIQTLKEDPTEITTQQYLLHKQFISDFFTKALSLRLDDHPNSYTKELLNELTMQNNEHQNTVEKNIYSFVKNHKSEPSFISTQLNVSHEIHHAVKSFIQGLSSWQNVIGKNE